MHSLGRRRAAMEAAVGVGAGRVAIELLEEAWTGVESDGGGQQCEDVLEDGRSGRDGLAYTALHRIVLDWAMAAGPESGSGRAGLVPRLLELWPPTMRPSEALALLQEALEVQGATAQPAWRVEAFRGFLLGLA